LLNAIHCNAIPSSKTTYDLPSRATSHVVKEEHVEYGFIGKLQNLKHECRADIRDRAALERNFREKFEALNRVRLSDAEFARLLDGIVTADVFTAARTLRERNAFTRDDGTPLNYTLFNIKEWCKNTFEVVNQLRINTDNSHPWARTRRAGWLRRSSRWSPPTMPSSSTWCAMS